MSPRREHRLILLEQVVAVETGMYWPLYGLFADSLRTRDGHGRSDRARRGELATHGPEGGSFGDDGHCLLAEGTGPVVTAMGSVPRMPTMPTLSGRAVGIVAEATNPSHRFATRTAGFVVTLDGSGWGTRSFDFAQGDTRGWVWSSRVVDVGRGPAAGSGDRVGSDPISVTVLQPGVRPGA